jgi:hypothetical protein
MADPVVGMTVSALAIGVLMNREEQSQSSRHVPRYCLLLHTLPNRRMATVHS